MPSDLDTLTSPQYLADLGSRTIADIRAMRAECQQLENDLSFVRRMAHGRLDIVGGEVSRRRRGAAPADATELLDELPTLLGDREHGRGSSTPRPPQTLEPSPAADQLVGELDEIVTTGQLTALADVDDDELGRLIDRLQAFETRISKQRRALHETIDAVQREIVERYRSGEASVDAILE